MADILSSEDEKALGEGDGGMGHQLIDRHVMSDLRLKEFRDLLSLWNSALPKSFNKWSKKTSVDMHAKFKKKFGQTETELNRTMETHFAAKETIRNLNHYVFNLFTTVPAFHERFHHPKVDSVIRMILCKCEIGRSKLLLAGC